MHFDGLWPGFSNHGSRPKIGSRRTLLWVSGTIMGRMGRRQICNTYIYIYIYNENIFDGVFLEKKFFFIRVIWVAGRTRTPIIGSLQKSRENPGLMVSNFCNMGGDAVNFSRIVGMDPPPRLHTYGLPLNP